METYLAENWELPEEWRLWAAKRSPPHAHVVSADAEKFKTYWIGEEAKKKNWRAAWEKWWLRTIERPPLKAAKNKFEISCTTVRDTSEPFAVYKARMIAAGLSKE